MLFFFFFFATIASGQTYSASGRHTFDSTCIVLHAAIESLQAATVYMSLQHQMQLRFDRFAA